MEVTMTKRGIQLNMQHEHEQTLQELEEKRPQGETYKVFSENGSQGGRMVYKPEDDTLIMKRERQASK
jgi:hypothetical protein